MDTDIEEPLNFIQITYKKFCEETKRNGGVLIGQSISEWHRYLANEFEKELIEFQTDTIRSTGTFLREDLNPEFLKTIDELESNLNRTHSTPYTKDK